MPGCSVNLGAEAASWWESHGGRLFDWQKLGLEGILGLGDDNRWVCMEDGLDVARQNGKGVVLQVVEGFFAFELGYELVTHTAHEFKTCREHMHRMMSFVQNAPGLHARVRDRGGYMTANGNESINLKSGGRILFHARSKLSGRGFSGDLLVWDEAMVIPESVVGAQMPNLRASDAPHGQKIIYAGSAVDQMTMEYGVTFARLRERGMNEDPFASWQEWSAPHDDPSTLTDEMLYNREWWHMANPSMSEGLIPEATMEREVASMASRTVAVELLGIGDWPRTDGLEQSVITAEAWDACLEEGSQLQPGFVLVFDVSPERHTTIAAVGFNEAGKFHAEVHEHRPGTSWLPKRLAEMVERGTPDGVFCDGLGPAASMIKDCDAAGVTVEPIDTKDHTRACGRLVDLVAEGSLVHLGSQELRDAVLGAAQRPVGDAWAWSRKNSSVNIAPLVAVTLGVGMAELVTGAQVF